MDEDLPRCAYCGDAISIHEPTIVRQSSETREPSQAGGLALARQETSHYHRACHDAVRGSRRSNAGKT